MHQQYDLKIRFGDLNLSRREGTEIDRYINAIVIVSRTW